MDIIIKKILEGNTNLLQHLKKEIHFEIDHEGKRIINQQTQQLYKRRLSQEQIVRIVLTSIITIEKMLCLEKCDWSSYELHERLYNSLAYYSGKFDIDLEKIFEKTDEEAVQFIQGINEKFPPKYRAIDGHYVRSKSELLIDNLLFNNNIVHAYEKRLPYQKYMFCDFYLPPCKARPFPIYIEHWGYSGENYLIRKREKLKVYQNLNLRLVETYEEDTHRLHEVLADKLSGFEIQID